MAERSKTSAAEAFLKKAGPLELDDDAITLADLEVIDRVRERLEIEARYLTNAIDDAYLSKGVGRAPAVKVEMAEEPDYLQVNLVDMDGDSKSLMAVFPREKKIGLLLDYDPSIGYDESRTADDTVRSVDLPVDLDKLSSLMGRHAMYLLQKDETSPLYNPKLTFVPQPVF